MITALLILLQAVGILLLLDFVTGILHWLEDSYCTEKTLFLGSLVCSPNIIHHQEPRRFTKYSFIYRNSSTAAMALLIFLTVWMIFGISWHLVLFCSVGALCNEFHCWAHRSPKENGRFICWLHHLRILQTPRHHAMHHMDPKNRTYCVLTNFLNPVLDKLHFWRGTEMLLQKLFGLVPRSDFPLGTEKQLNKTP